MFEDLGKEMLTNVTKGYNCSLFAYGQTGSGKSYTIMGFGANKGIIPIMCEELFKTIDEMRKASKPDQEFQVSVSMMEIYNEQVRDLLNLNLQLRGGLKVRQHPTKGFYVESLTTHPVYTYGDIESRIAEGTRNRTMAATNLNATSSRAHTIVTIYVNQRGRNSAGEYTTKMASLNLVDLAGSERSDVSGTSGDRLKEGSIINQSLSTLGNVIKCLADINKGKQNILVPYRDSVLTKLLKNALGGNSKTAMIATISPADIHYEETLSTLRFANRAKNIKTKAVVNESSTDRLVRALREENDRLRQMLEKANGTPTNTGSDEEEMRRALEEQLKKNQKEMEQMNKSWQQRLQDVQVHNQRKLEMERKEELKKKTIPHLWNLHEDPALTGMIVHFAMDGKSRVGTKKVKIKPDIVLSGLSILPDHAVILKEGNVVTVVPSTGARVLVNGSEIKASKVLRHNDRVLFGHNHLYVLHNPQDLAKQLREGLLVEQPTYDTAQQEIAERMGLIGLTGNDGRNKTQDDLLLEEELIQILPHMNQANAISQELGRKVQFEIVLVAPQARGLKEGRTYVCVKMKNKSSGHEWVWSTSKFTNRMYLMQAMYQQYMEGQPDWDSTSKETDPFWEGSDTEVPIGTVHVYLQSLAYVIELDETLAITDFKGNEQGLLHVVLIPCDENGCETKDNFLENPQDLIGHELTFKIKILMVTTLPAKIVRCFCKYKFYLDEVPVVTEESYRVSQSSQAINHEKLLSFNPVTKQFLTYLINSAMIIEVWGKQEDWSSTMNTPPSTSSMISSARSSSSSVASLNGVIQDEELQTRSVQLAMYRRRAEQAEGKLQNIQSLIEVAAQQGITVVELAEIKKILGSGSGAAGKVRSSLSRKASTNSSDTRSAATVTSETCIVQ
ncbi:PREDICTED: kinesin-like protein KIF28P [Priapulus caudatus]|uniref:Kinesin-like protein n=1 Tax=Priapulus caudatus TaxID=37621 RepID=A0ABM1E564_PRICU|nr:PREDICTED: kinesin-like protein KIF28P [Priapulus caudatus]